MPSIKTDPLKEIKKYCYEKGKSEYKGKKPYGMYWGMHTSHLKSLSDWAYARSVADSEEKRGKKWFVTFFGQLRVQPWQRK